VHRDLTFAAIFLGVVEQIEPDVPPYQIPFFCSL
jgi:hypothetical protein